MSPLFDLLEKALDSDLAGWRANLRRQDTHWGVGPDDWLDFNPVLSQASRAETKQNHATLDRTPVVLYGGSLEKALGPGVWTDGLHIWVAKSTVVACRRQALRETREDGSLYSSRAALSDRLLAAGEVIRSQEHETPLSNPACSSRPWEDVVALLETLPEGRLVLADWPEGGWSNEDVRRFQVGGRKPSEADTQAVLNNPMSATGLLGDPDGARSALQASLGGRVTDTLVRCLRQHGPDAFPLLMAWSIGWGVPPGGAIARASTAFDAYRNKHHANDKGSFTISPDAAAFLEGRHPAALGAVDVIVSRVGHNWDHHRGYRVYDDWDQVTLALRDSTPQTEEEDLARWYGMFLNHEWSAAEKTRGRQTAWASLVPDDPAWRGDARWWKGDVKKDGLQFLLAQGQKVPEETSKRGSARFGALHRAALLADPRMLTDLLARGTPVNSVNDQRQTALFGARAGKSTQLLLDAGADVMHRGRAGRTPLHEAFRKKESSLKDPKDWKVTQLLAAGADPNARTIQNETPLHVMLETDPTAHGPGRLDIMLKAGAEPFALDKQGRCPITKAWMLPEPSRSWEDSWLEIWLKRPELSPAELPFEAAQALHTRLLSHGAAAYEANATAFFEWWQKHLDLQRLREAMPDTVNEPRRHRM